MRFILTTLLFCAVAQAATSNATITINSTVTIGTTAVTAAGTATLTGGIAASGTFTGTVPLASVTGSTLTAAYTITTSAGTLSGTLLIPSSVLTGTSTTATGSGTITSGTGSYAGDTGSFPTLTGIGGVNAAGAVTLVISGSGTVTTNGTTSTTPTITAVLDNASNTPNVAQGGYFIVKGTNLSSSGLNSLVPPYPTSTGGTSITFTSATGATTQPYLFYTYLVGGVNQLGGIIPSTLATGSYNVTVTYNGSTSAPFATQVVASKPTIFTQDESGGGLASVQNIISATQYDLNRLTTGTVNGYTTSPAKPGQTLIVWGTGLGAVPYGDNIVPPSSHNFANVQVIVGGLAITPLYAGASGYPAEDQINFTLPANVPTGCTVSLQVSVGGTLSPPTTLSIAPTASASACVLPGYTTSQLTALDQGGTVTVGGFSLSQIAETVPTYGTIKIDSISGGFTQVTGFELGSLPLTFSSVTSGSCTVIQVSGTSGQLSAGGTVTNLDAGNVTLTGPSGSNLTNTALPETSNSYLLSIGEEGLPGGAGVNNGVIVAGKYTLAGAGGNDVGNFTTSITLGSPLSVTGGLPSNVVRSQGLTLNWTGGNSTDPVAVIGYAGASSGTGASAVTTATEFICTSTAGAGTLTVPASVLNQLPQVLSTTTNGTGFLELTSGPSPVTFSPSLKASGAAVASTFSALIASGASVTYQ